MAKMETLQDAFNGAALDTGKWSNDGGVTVTGGRCEIAPGSSLQGLSSKTGYDINSSYLILDIEGMFNMPIPGSNHAFRCDGSNVGLYQAGFPPQEKTYNKAAMRYFRLKPQGSTMYVDYSSDGQSWYALGNFGGSTTQWATFTISIVNTYTAPARTFIRGVNVIETANFLPFFI